MAAFYRRAAIVGGMDGQSFDLGDNVTIVGGTFDGFSGPIITADEATEMPHSVPTAAPDGLWIAINIFGRTVPVQIPPAELRLA